MSLRVAVPVRIVIDTNVVISALLSPNRTAAQVVDLVLDGEITAVLDARIATEYREVAARPRFGFDPTSVMRVLDALERVAEHVVARPLAVTLPHADDVPFLEVATDGHADALVTGNARHFVPVAGTHGVTVHSPRELLDALRGVG